MHYTIIITRNPYNSIGNYLSPHFTSLNRGVRTGLSVKMTLPPHLKDHRAYKTGHSQCDIPVAVAGLRPSHCFCEKNSVRLNELGALQQLHRATVCHHLLT